MNKQETKVLGELALDIISDYPLYANRSNITYEEAIKICKVFYPDVSDWEEVASEL